ncbi:MAG: signal peptidase II [Betaproteobacteria bacterium]
MKNKYLLVGSIISIVLILDQITKYIVEKQVRLYEVIRVVPGFFNITHVRNKGAAFSLFSNAPETYRSMFFITVTIVAVAVIAALIRKTRERLLIVSFSLIAGGAVGNLIDRVRYGEVVDFIQWYVKSYYWPSFNVADSAITIGVGLLVIDMLSHRRSQDAAKSL